MNEIEVKPLSIREWFCQEVATRVGYPYIWGARGPYAFDCCGLVEWGMKQVGRPFKKDIASWELLHIFHNNKVIKGAEKLGSLYLYSSKKNPIQVSHVCIFFRQWKNGKKLLIGANHGNSITTGEDIAAKAGAMVQIVPDDYRIKDLVFILDPFMGEE